MEAQTTPEERINGVFFKIPKKLGSNRRASEVNK
jgi:hypothetical protein